MDNASKHIPELTDAAKAAVLDSGIISELKQAVFSGKVTADDTDTLKGKAEAMADELQQLINSGTLDDADLQKFSTVLMRLRGALQNGTISREALAAVLSEASGAVATASSSKSQAMQEKIEQLWQQLEQHNKAINDDFDTMRKAGMVFDDELWKKHERLLRELQEHPRDIEKQKELNAVDDKLLEEAESQLAKHPEARPAFEHAKTESEARHKVVDHDLVALEKNINDMDSAWDKPPVKENASTLKASLEEVTLNDIESQHVGQKLKNQAIVISSYVLLASFIPIKILQIFVYMQTKVCLRTKSCCKQGLFHFTAIVKAFIIKVYNDSLSSLHHHPAGKSVQI